MDDPRSESESHVAPSVALVDRGALASIEGEWTALAARACEANPFLEPFFLVPALETLGDDRGAGQSPAISILTVRVQGELALLVPLVTARRTRGVPLAELTTWRNLYDALGTPLLHRTHARPALGAMLDWMKERPEHVLELTDVGADGPFRAALVDVLRERKTTPFVADSHTRAVLRPGANAEDYLQNVLDGRKRKELRRLERRLAEALGPVEGRVYRTVDEMKVFAPAFLAVEASGWKAERGTAFASNDAHRRFFERVVLGAAELGQVDGFALRAGDKVVAALCSLRAGPEKNAFFAWKIAYDEAYAKYSPGILLEIENIRRLHGQGELFMDSCASPDHQVSNRLWSERRILETVLLPNDRRGAWLVSSMPLLQLAKRSASTLAGYARLRKRKA